MAGMEAFPVVTPLSREECLALLAGARVGRVAINVAALPAIRTVRFALSSGHVVFRVAPGSALCRAASGVVAFQADHYDPDSGAGWCVEAVGRCQRITDPVVLETVRLLPLEAWAPPGEGDHFFGVRLGTVSGQHVQLPH